MVGQPSELAAAFSGRTGSGILRLGATTVVPMDFDAPRPWWPLGDLVQMHERVQHWIDRNWDTNITVGAWWARLASAGLAAPTWDRHHGGLGATTRVQLLVEQRLAATGAIAPPTVHPAIKLVGPALRQFATEPQIKALLPRLLTGHDLWTVMMFDPGEHDAAATECRAEFDWKYVTIDGVKACDDHTADRALALFRSGKEGREGLTWMVIDLADTSITRGDRTLEFRSMRTTHDRVIGTRDDGWALTKTSLPFIDRSIAGRIRRGLVHVQPGAHAGNLDRTVADVLATHRRGLPPPIERRAR